MISHQSIGFFDSGWGGLSILKTARKVLPHENFIYVADCGFAPYGDRSHDFIVERARKIASFLLETKQVKALVIACNTATAEAIDSLRQQWPQAIIIGVEPAVKAAVTLSKNKRIGMISTTRTAQSERYHRLLERFGHNATIISQGCPGLMECVEAGEFNTPGTQELLHQYLAPMLEQKIDTLILGCTHYPFLSQAIEGIAGPNVTLYEPSHAVVRHLENRLAAINALKIKGDGEETFYVTGLTEHRKSVACRLWGKATLFENLEL